MEFVGSFSSFLICTSFFEDIFGLFCGGNCVTYLKVIVCFRWHFESFVSGRFLNLKNKTMTFFGDSFESFVS